MARADLPSFGELWSTSLHRRIVVDGADTGVRVSRGGGRVVSFSGNGTGAFTSAAAVNDRLKKTVSGYLYVDAQGAQETYDAAGLLLTIVKADGTKLSFVYSDATTLATIAPAAGYLLSVQDWAGRAIQFQYTSAGAVRQITDPSNNTITAVYDGLGNLSDLTWQDGSTRKFVHENTALPWALTGVIDERGVRFATIGYDADGRAVSSELAGGADSFSVSYATAPRVAVVDTYDGDKDVVFRTRRWAAPVTPEVTMPNSSKVVLDVADVADFPRLTARSQPAGSGCAASTSKFSYDANGNPASIDNFNGSRSCHVYDLTRNLATVQVEGLASTQDCSAVTPASATLPAGSRKVSSQWHPDWRLKTKEAAPGVLTTSVYNGQPDPFNGNTAASCTPASAVLPDGKPIVLLCKQVEQATTDGDGSRGFSAVLDTSVAKIVWTYTYNQYGQVLTAKGLRTDVNDTTTYAYYTDTTIDHTLGDLQSVTNPAGHVTQYLRYDKAGRLLRSIDPTGAMTDITYKPRGWVESVTVTPAGGGTAQVTTYSYDAVGQLKQVTLPDVVTLQYTNDDAHRLTSITDGAGNTVTYTLDNAGNRTGETLKDAGGNLARNITRVFDALGRVQQVTGGGA